MPADLPDPGIKPWVSCIAGNFFTVWATREALMNPNLFANRKKWTDKVKELIAHTCSSTVSEGSDIQSKQPTN